VSDYSFIVIVPIQQFFSYIMAYKGSV